MTNEFENENESDTNDNANEYTRMYTDSNDSDAEITEPEETSQVEEIPYGEETPQAEENNTNFIMRSSTESDKAEAKARQQVEKEKIKFEEKRKKAAIKMEKKAAKKAARNGKGHGVVFKTVRLVVCAAAFGVIALGTMYLTGDSLGLFKEDSKTTTTIPSTQVSNTNKGSTTALQTSSDNSTTVMDVSDVVYNVMPSIVAITSTQLVQSSNDWYDYYFGNGNGNNNNGYTEQTGAGSGIIIGQNDTELLIVTNNHVVEDADSLQIKFIDNETVSAVVKGTDSNEDLAVVAVKLSDIKESTLEQIKIATLGDSDDLKVGQGTIAIGNALGYGQSVTTGVVSALNREVEYEDRTMTLIQTDAAINPGNSGGALLNTKGEVIGINAAKYSSSSIEGMGFAIPVSSVKDVIEELMNKETLTKVDSDKKGYLNIYGRDVTSSLSETYSVPTGIYIIEVIENGAADKAGIEKTNVITAINGESVSSMEELQEKLEYYEKGTKVTLTVEYAKGNDYKEKEVEVTLGDEME